MLKNWALAAAVSLFTLAAGLGLLRTLAPGLLGRPTEVHVVQSSEAVPPFFEHVFSGVGTTEPLRDPVTVVREFGLQLESAGAGPTDLLGFRNRGIPNHSDVVVVGDSQTYGMGAAFTDTWPQRLAIHTRRDELQVYNMAANGWGPTQYVAMSRHAGVFRPRLVVVAYYTGNDAHDAFSQAYVNPRWKRLRVSRTLGPGDAPRAVWPVPESDRFAVRLPDGVQTIFTPGYRFDANDRSHPGVREGYDILARTASVIANTLEGFRVPVAFTVIPTKEYVYSARLRETGVAVPRAYQSLVADEERNLAELVTRLRGMRKGRYIDVVTPLQAAARLPRALYRTDADGHPAAGGHDVIALAVAAEVRAVFE